MVYFSDGRIYPVPLSVTTEISLGSLTKENCYGSNEWFSITTETLEALLWKTLPKSIAVGLKVTELTVNTDKMLNLTGSTWLAPVTLIGILIVNSSYSSFGGASSSYLIRYL